MHDQRHLDAKKSGRTAHGVDGTTRTGQGNKKKGGKRRGSTTTTVLTKKTTTFKFKKHH